MDMSTLRFSRAGDGKPLAGGARHPNGRRKINTSMTNSADTSLYHLFERRGLTRSHRHFSATWLRAAPNYMALRGSRPPSAEVLVGLFQLLWARGHLILAIRVGWTILWMPEAQR